MQYICASVSSSTRPPASHPKLNSDRWAIRSAQLEDIELSNNSNRGQLGELLCLALRCMNLPPRRSRTTSFSHPYRGRRRARIPSSSTAPRYARSRRGSNFPCRGRRPAWSSASLRTCRTRPCSSSSRSGCPGFRCCRRLCRIVGTARESKGFDGDVVRHSGGVTVLSDEHAEHEQTPRLGAKCHHCRHAPTVNPTEG